jgi:hypothetical protein
VTLYLVRADFAALRSFDFSEHHTATGQHNQAIEEASAPERRHLLGDPAGRFHAGYQLSFHRTFQTKGLDHD